MTKEMYAKIVNFITIWAGGHMLWRGYIGYYSEYALSSTLSIYITLIAFVLTEYNATFLCHYWFSFIKRWGSWYPNMSPSEINSVQSLILWWPLRALVCLIWDLFIYFSLSYYLTFIYRTFTSYSRLCFTGFRKLSHLTSLAMMIKYQQGGTIYLSM